MPYLLFEESLDALQKIDYGLKILKVAFFCLCMYWIPKPTYFTISNLFWTVSSGSTISPVSFLIVIHDIHHITEAIHDSELVYWLDILTSRALKNHWLFSEGL